MCGESILYLAVCVVNTDGGDCCGVLMSSDIQSADKNADKHSFVVHIYTFLF